MNQLAKTLNFLAACGIAFGALASSASPLRAQTVQPLPYTGVNLSGGEFGKPKKGVTLVYGKSYVYPSEQDIAYFASRGMNIVRIPFRWETLQPSPRADLDSADLARLKKSVAFATDRGLTVILDPHDYARYYGSVIGGPEVSDDDFADFWGKLAAAFRSNDHVWFGLMNEPHNMPTAQWRDAANAAVAAIRSAGANNRILIPGNSWSGAHSWEKAGNDLLLTIHDPANNSIFEAHQYLDSDSSGTHPDAVSATIGSERLRGFVDWCRRNHRQAFLGEFAVGAGDANRAALENMLAGMEKDRDVWVGFTWWSAGAWWGNYMFSLEPKSGEDKPQMSYLAPHLQKQPVQTSRR